VLITCALAAAVNLVAAVMLTPRTDAPAPVAAESQPAASVRDVPAPAPPVPDPEPLPRVAAVPREALDLPPRDASLAAERLALRTALDEWIAATNRRDLARQMSFYPPTVSVFYRDRNVPRTAVLAEKRRLFGRAQVVEVRAGPPDITLDGPDAATMRFRKTYDIRGPQATRRGEVVQELRWVKTPAGWKITGERDAQVIR
jgi:hypothetical protein